MEAAFVQQQYCADCEYHLHLRNNQGIEAFTTWRRLERPLGAGHWLRLFDNFHRKYVPAQLYPAFERLEGQYA